MSDLLPIFDLLLVFLLAFVGGFIAKKLKQPLILGYVLAGIVGGNAIGLVRDQSFITTLAEIGIVFLMFSLGIEFSFARLLRVRGIAILGGIAQIIITLILGIIIFPRLGFTFYSSLFLASCFSLSSTAVVTKILTERGEIDSLPGEIMMGMLLIQDLAVLPMILILPQIANLTSDSWVYLAVAIVKALILLGLIFILGRAIIPRFLAKIAAVNSREIFVLSIVTLCFTAALGTYVLGLSFALGAFLAGLIISESAQNHAVFSEIRPLRDIFSIVFFVSLGMMLPFSFLFSHLWIIICLSLLIIIIKFVIVFIISFYFHYHFKIAFLVGVALTQVGEFSFILSKTGMDKKLISFESYSIIISVALLTIVLTPFLMVAAPQAYLLLSKGINKYFPKIYARFFHSDHHLPEDESVFFDHIVICGYGRVGGWLGRALTLCQVPFIVVDYNHQVVNELKNRGIPVIYGDPSDVDVLDQAKVNKAKTIVVAIPDRHTQEMIVGNALSLNSKIEIICRTHFQEDQSRLKALGVNTVIQPEFEASLSIIHRILQGLGFDHEDVSNKLKRIKLEHGMD